MITNARAVVPRPWGDGCMSYDLVDRDQLIVVQETMPPGTSEVRHVHVRARQFFFVLTGTLTIERDGQSFELNARDGLEIAPGMAHIVSNRSPAPVAFLAIASPTTKGDRVPAPT